MGYAYFRPFNQETRAPRFGIFPMECTKRGNGYVFRPASDIMAEEETLMQSITRQWEFIKWGVAYLAVIIVFGLLYWIFCVELGATAEVTPFKALYFSVVTITTLGFGEIYPQDTIAQTLVVCEVLTGVVVIGCFLNSIARYQNEAMVRRQSMAKFRRHFRIIRRDMARLFQYTAMLTAGVYDHDKSAETLAELKFSDLKNTYAPSNQPTDSPLEPVAYYFFKYRDFLHDDFKSLLQQVDFLEFATLEDNLFRFIELCHTLDSKGYVLSVPQRDWEAMTARIAQGGDAPQAAPGSLLNPYIMLYQFIGKGIPVLEEIRRIFEKITK